MIHFLDAKTDKLIGYLDGNGERIYADDEIEENTDGLKILNVSIPAHLPEAVGIEERQRIIVPHEREGYGWQEFICYNGRNSRKWKKVTAIGSETELDKLKIVTPGKREGFTLRQYIDLGVDGIDWKAGIVLGKGTKTLEFDEYMGGHDFLQRIATAFDVELIFRIVIEGSQVVGRYVDVVQRIGRNEGKEFVNAKDLVDVEIEVFTERIITGLIVLRPDKEDGTPQEPIFITDEAAFQRWGRKGQHLYGIHRIDSTDGEMTEEEARQYGRTELNKRIASVVEYTVDAIDLAPMFPHEAAYLGDVVRIMNEDYNPPLFAQARILSVKRKIRRLDEERPMRKIFTIGEVVNYKKDTMTATFQSLQSRYGMKIVKQPEAPEPNPNIIWIQTGTGKPIDPAHIWTGSSWGVIAPTTAAEIGADPAGSAAAALAAAREEISDVLIALDNFEDVVNTTFRDGVIESAEAAAIEKYKNTINAEKVNVDNDFTAIYNNSDLVAGTIKTAFDTAKTNYNTAHTALIASINMAILDGRTTADEKADVDAKFTTYRTRLASYSIALHNASNSITKKQAADAQAAAVAAAATDATEKANAAQAAGEAAAVAQAELARIAAESFADGAIDAEEQARILQAAENLAAAELDATNKAAAAQAAAELHADAIRTDLESQMGQLSTALNDFETEIGSSFRDGIIEEAEAKAIEKYKNLIETEKLDIDNRFTKIYADASLTGTPKTNLNSAKTAFDTAHTNLLASINAAIADGKTTATEKADVDAKFTAYRTAQGTLSTRFEEAITALTAAKDAKVKTDAATDATTKAGTAKSEAITAAAADAKTKADAAQAAGEAAAVAQAELARIAAEAYADGQLDVEEERAIAEAQRVLDEATLFAQAAADAVTDSENFLNIIQQKVDVDAIGDLATKDELAGIDSTIDGRIDTAVNAIDLSHLATKDELAAGDNALKESLSSASGVNLLRNSIGYGDLDFWEFVTTAQTVVSIMDEELSTLGFGSGFYFPPGTAATGIQQTVNVKPGQPYTLSWFLNKATAGTFSIEIFEGTTLKMSVPDIAGANMDFNSSYVPYTPEGGTLTVRLTASAGTEATITGLMLGRGDLPTQWTLANGELYNSYVRVDDRGLIVMRVNAEGAVEGYTNMTPEEFAGYYDENSDGSFEKMFWFDRDETVTKKLKALEEITMGTIKIVRVESATNRGWAFVPIVPE